MHERPRFLTIREVCVLLQLGERTVYDLCRRGRLAGAAKVGGQWRVDESRLLDWLAQGGQATPGLADDAEPSP